MPIVFKSQRSSDVLMLAATGRQVLTLLGKDPDAARGVVTVEQLPAAIAAIQTAIARDKADHAEAEVDDESAQDPDGPPVQLFRRLVPVLELLQSAGRHEVPVTWGV